MLSVLVQVTNNVCRLVFEAAFLLSLIEPVVPQRLRWVLKPLRAIARSGGEASEHDRRTKEL